MADDNPYKSPEAVEQPGQMTEEERPLWPLALFLLSVCINSLAGALVGIGWMLIGFASLFVGIVVGGASAFWAGKKQ